MDDLHAKLLTLDAHLDTTVHFSRPGWRFDERHDLATDLAQVDMPRMEGNLDGGFFVIFTPQGPLTPEGYAVGRDIAFRRSAAIDATVARFSGRIGPVRTASDAKRLKAEGKLIAFKSIENSYPLGDDVALLSEFYHQGVRLAGPVHVKSNQFADSSTDESLWDGLSVLGRRWVAEMNRLGMLIDASHASDAALDAMLDLSSAPIILSHSGARAAFDHPRNVDDGRLRALAARGGVICFTTVFLSAMNARPERLGILRALSDLDDFDTVAQAELAVRRGALDAVAPMWSAGLDEYMAALHHVIDVVGVDHVGFGADWDGGGGVTGLQDVTALPVITSRLIEAGLSESDCAKLWGGNLMQALAEAQICSECTWCPAALSPDSPEARQS